MPRFLTWAAGAAVFGLTAGPALAQTYKLDKIEINGVTSVPVQPLRDGLTLKPGARVTTDDLIAGQDQLTKELEAAHVTGGVKTSLRNKNNGHVDVIYAVNDTGVVQPKTVVQQLHLAHVSFAGNAHVETDTLVAAAQMKPGDVVTDDTVKAAQQNIAAAYKKALTAKGIGAQANIQPQITYPTQGQVDILWQVTEAKVKKKQRNTEDEGFHTE